MPLATRFTAVGGRAYFAATDATHGTELWTSDGTAAGTKLVKDLRVGTGSAIQSAIYAYAGKVYFSAFDGTSANLYASDGTAGGTVEVATLGTEASIEEAVEFDGKLFFTVFNADGPQQTNFMWSTEGTPASTAKIPGDVSAAFLTATPSILFFRGVDATQGGELFALDAVGGSGDTKDGGTDGGASATDGGIHSGDGGSAGNGIAGDAGNAPTNKSEEGGNGSSGGCSVGPATSASESLAAAVGLTAIVALGRRRRKVRAHHESAGF